jgi:16S rRNA (adenine1518-N6/adenine1519-N6)-dimethyltransferase
MTDAGGDGLPPLRAVIATHDLRAKKALGQNFLFDLNLTRRIARAAGPLDGATVYEVGPGPGGLTRALLAEGAAKVIAVERDRRCLPVLEEIAAAYPGRLEILSADALAIDEASVLPQGARIAANLPYNVGTALLIKWLTAGASTSESEGGISRNSILRPGVRPNKSHWPPAWLSLTLMFQKEVAQRITARPGTEHYGRLSVLAGWRTHARILFDVPARAFVPPPSVTSSVVRLEPHPEPLAPCALADLERVTAAAIGQRRKMLRQSLKALGGEALIARAGLDPTARPQDLTIADFAALARALGA